MGLPATCSDPACGVCRISHRPLSPDPATNVHTSTNAPAQAQLFAHATRASIAVATHRPTSSRHPSHLECISDSQAEATLPTPNHNLSPKPQFNDHRTGRP